MYAAESALVNKLSPAFDEHLGLGARGCETIRGSVIHRAARYMLLRRTAQSSVRRDHSDPVKANETRFCNRGTFT